MNNHMTHKYPRIPLNYKYCFDKLHLKSLFGIQSQKFNPKYDVFPNTCNNRNTESNKFYPNLKRNTTKKYCYNSSQQNCKSSLNKDFFLAIPAYCHFSAPHASQALVSFDKSFIGRNYSNLVKFEASPRSFHHNSKFIRDSRTNPSKVNCYQRNIITNMDTSSIDNESVIVEKAVVLDIDGVLVRANEPIDGAAEAINLLKMNNIPFILLTNGGGLLEADKAADISRILGVDINVNQIQMSHSPMVKIVKKYKDDIVLIVGSNDFDKIALSLGFNNIITCQEYHSLFPASYRYTAPKFMKNDVIKKFLPLIEDKSSPFASHQDENILLDYAEKIKGRIKSIIVLNDPIDWHLELQTLLDLIIHHHLNSVDGSKSLPIYCSNGDFLYTNDFELPRLGLGSFSYCMIKLFKKFLFYEKSGSGDTDPGPSPHDHLNLTFFGKPNKVAYEYAKSLLKAQALFSVSLQQNKRVVDDYLSLNPHQDVIFKKIYAVGDNPYSDIAGSNNAGSEWFSILVRTGIYTGIGNHEIHPARIVTDSVLHAVKYVIDKV